MPVFRYKAYRAEGADVAGTIEAGSLRDASLKLKGQGLHPSEISEHRPSRRLRLLGGDKNWLPELTRHLSVLMRSGVPLSEALDALVQESRGHTRGMLVGIKERVQGGASLARALKECDGAFPEFYSGLVEAGQESGTLDRVLDGLADFLESQDSTREKIRTAMIYPTIMAAVGALVLAFLFTFVIPKIVVIFEDSGAALPAPTVVLLAISNFLVNYWWLALAAAVALAFGAKSVIKRQSLLLDRYLLKLPLQSLYYARFTRTLGMLLEGGLPMLRALELSGRATGNTWLQGRVKDAASRMSEGGRLSVSLEGVPPVLAKLIATGERSGTLAEVLRSAADSYEADFDRLVQRSLALVEPAMILVMGAVVGFIVLAVLLPMFQLNEIVR